MEYCSNFDISGYDFSSRLQKKYGKSVNVENDANAATLGEYVYRTKSGGNLTDMVLLTLRVGVFGGIIIGGKLYKGFNYAGGEIGHMIIEKNGR